MKTAIVTGANRGIGLEVCRQLAHAKMQVVLTSRDSLKGEQAAHDLRKQGLNVQFHQLDVSNDQSVASLKKYVEHTFGAPDILINNAGIFPEDHDSSSIFEANLDLIRQAIETNTLGPLRMCKAFIPLMLKKGYGRVVNVSTGMAQLTEMNGNYPAYRLSKTALNAVTRIFADETQGKNILVNSVCPGWVKTDMGGEGADRPVEKGAETIVWLAQLPDRGPTGGFFRDKEPIDW